MRKWVPAILVAVFAAWSLSTLKPSGSSSGVDYRQFGRLPVLLNGRIQPFDSVARNSLLMMRGKQRVPGEEKKPLSPIEWLLEVMLRPEKADQRQIFRVQHQDLQSLIGGQAGRLKYYSFQELTPKLIQIEEQARPLIDSKKDEKLQSPYEKDLLHLFRSLILYHQLKNSLRPEHPADFLPADAREFAFELKYFEESIGPGLAALRQSEAGQTYNEQDLQLTVHFFGRYKMLAELGHPMVVPPLHPEQSRDAWNKLGASLMESLRSGQVHPAVHHFAAIASAYRESRPAEFNQAVAKHQEWLASQNLLAELNKGRREYFFNQLQPFYKSMVIYVAALLFGCAFWLNWSPWLRQSAFSLLGLAFVIHTFGLLFRMFLEGRPPVTNLYSSAIFVGWGAVVLGMILERIYRDGIGAVTAASVGFATQIIAHHLAMGGDTMQMLQAVLDTNFWLATHVVAIATGYASMFIAGFLAIIYILRGVLTPTLSAGTGRALSRMIYGVVCFSTLFSFVGTILGGIWADQSWGRFWGWDPKENGALLIVIWNAIILHARWGGMVRERGLAVMAVFGNIITSFSWFGVNMLGVGLHSYGFMDKAFYWLMLFVASQLMIMALGLLPFRYWISFRRREQLAPGVGGLSAEPSGAEN